MSPSFINRFDVIVLENQIEKISDKNLEKLISYLFVSLKSKINQMVFLKVETIIIILKAIKQKNQIILSQKKYFWKN